VDGTQSPDIVHFKEEIEEQIVPNCRTGQQKQGSQKISLVEKNKMLDKVFEDIFSTNKGDLPSITTNAKIGRDV